MNNEIKTWRQRMQDVGRSWTYSVDPQELFKEAEIAELRARIESLAADAERSAIAAQAKPMAMKDEQIEALAEEYANGDIGDFDYEGFARAILANSAPNALLVEAAQSAYSYLFATGLKTKHPAEFQTCSHLSDKLRHALADVGVEVK